MCGIVGYIGFREAQPVLIGCLERLEYRGYDSCGIAVADSELKVYKDIVRVKELRETCPLLGGTVGIGHTRWATHGVPSQVNAHPHGDGEGRIVVVHNGIITNYQELRESLGREGHVFLSETDTEVIPHLISKYYRGNLEDAVGDALRELEGSYAIIALTTGEDKLVVARKDSPLVIGPGDKENFIASDVPAMLDYTSRVVYLEDGDIGIVTKDLSKRSRDRSLYVDRLALVDIEGRADSDSGGVVVTHVDGGRGSDLDHDGGTAPLSHGTGVHGTIGITIGQKHAISGVKRDRPGGGHGEIIRVRP